jgi:hypothetical protein
MHNSTTPNECYAVRHTYTAFYHYKAARAENEQERELLLLVGVYTCSGLGSGARETKTAVNSPIDVILFGTRVDSKAARIILCSCAFRITGINLFLHKGHLETHSKY